MMHCAILYRFAIVAVSAGAFSFGRAAGEFAVIIAGELLWGIAVGWLMLRLRRVGRRGANRDRASILTP